MSLMIQPFEKIECLSSMKYTAWFISDSEKKPTEDKSRYQVLVEIDPWDKLINSNCECDGFKYSKGKPCRHIKELLNTLLEWGEIQELPTDKFIKEDVLE